jgi:hypothetical protein
MRMRLALEQITSPSATASKVDLAVVQAMFADKIANDYGKPWSAFCLTSNVCAPTKLQSPLSHELLANFCIKFARP